MAYMILSLLGFISVFIVRPNWTLNKQVASILLTILMGILFLIILDVYTELDIVIKGDSSLFKKLPLVEIGLYLATLAGMSFNYFYSAITRNGMRFDKWQFIKPMFVSPLVFGFTYAKMIDTSPSLLFFIFAFQNGFFWQTFLTRKRTARGI